ncbi:hypothetical protein SLA2020_186990 [Shorea laevis]
MQNGKEGMMRKAMTQEKTDLIFVFRELSYVRDACISVRIFLLVTQEPDLERESSLTEEKKMRIQELDFVLACVFNDLLITLNEQDYCRVHEPDINLNLLYLPYIVSQKSEKEKCSLL